MDIAEMQRLAFAVAREKGLHDGLPFDREGVLVRLMLAVTEVSEAAQEVKRRGLERLEVVGEELADVLIRCGDLAEGLGIDLAAAVAAKMERNRSRPFRFGTPGEASQ